MARNGMVPPVTLKGARVPIIRYAEFEPHKVQMKTVKVNGVDTRVPGLGPAERGADGDPGRAEAAVALARKSRAVVKTARPFEHPIVPDRRVG